MSKAFFWKCLAVLAVITFWASAPAWGQTTTGTIAGDGANTINDGMVGKYFVDSPNTVYVPTPQTPAPTAPVAPTLSVNSWSVTGAAMNLPGGSGTLAGTFTGIGMPITTNFSLTQTNFVAGDASFTGFYGGFGYRIAPFSKWLNDISPNLNGFQFNLRLVGSVGADRITSTSGNVATHWSEHAGGVLTYAVAGSKTWNLAADVEYLNAPGAPHKNNLFVAIGPSITF
jgi:hypothetical protein